MNDVMLPWPRPRRSGKDQPDPGQPSGAPRYEIQHMAQEDPTSPVEVLPVTRPPWTATSGRRGLLGAGIASSVAAALLLGGCDDGGSEPASSPSPAGSRPSSRPPTHAPRTQTPSPSTSSPDLSTPTYEPPTYDPPTYEPPTPTYEAPTPTYGGGGGVICTCNKVCTCIPVCQAHHLLHPDPAIRQLAEIVVLAMGTRELPYLRWAADEAPAPLSTRIEELMEEVRGGRRVGPGDLGDADCEPYLTSDDPVIAMMAAQVLSLRALSLGTGLSGVTAEHTARALTTGHALHLERAPAWSR